MNWEIFKSWILTGLVLLSIILFWNLVVFQENYEAIPNQEYINEVSIAEKRKIGELIFPDKMVYRKDRDTYVGSETISVVDSVFNEVARWNYYNFQPALEEFQQLFYNYNQPYLLFLFPDDVPFELMKNMFTIDAKEIPEGNFDYIVVFPNLIKKDEGIVYFVNEELTRAYQGRVRHPDMEHFLTNMNNFIESNSQPYIAYKKTSGSMLFVMDSDITLQDYRYLPKNYNVSNFVNALFQDPGLVKRKGNQYTDTSSLMNVYEDIGMFRFVDPTITRTKISVSELLQKGNDFINEHSGWTDHYYYSSSDIYNSKIVFRLYLSDFPVFSSSGYSEIKLVLGNDGVYSYERPLFSLNFPTTDREQILLSSGRRVLQFLESVDRFDMNTISDIRIGYQFTRAYNDMIISLEPSWFYRIDNTWQRIQESDLGGEQDGLE